MSAGRGLPPAHDDAPHPRDGIAPTSDRRLPYPQPDIPWRRFVALGDSFTEGLWDPPPGEAEHQRGWADRLAAALTARVERVDARQFEYANLAIRGRLADQILAEQVGPALRMKPDLVSLAAGGNDILRITCDVDALLATMEEAVRRIRATGADVLLATSADPAKSPVIRRIRTKAAVYYLGTWSIAQRHGAHVVDLWGMRALRDLRLWAPDRLHLTGEGHRRVANAALVALGLEPDDPDFAAPLPAVQPAPLATRAREDAAWARNHLVPWVGRHLRGQSTGDGRTPKRPAPAAIVPQRAGR